VKNILSIFLSNQLTLSSISSRKETVSLPVCMESAGPLHRLEEQSSSTYLLNQINPVCPLRSPVISILLMLYFNLGLGPKNQSNSEALCKISW